MSNLIAIVGPSGSGKSTSLFPSEVTGCKGLNPKETVIINVAAKPLPMKGAGKYYVDKKITEGGNYIDTNHAPTITKNITYVNEGRPEIKNIVIDDLGLSMSLEAFANVNVKGFDKFVNMAANLFNVLDIARKGRKDLNVICTFHQEKGDDNLLKIKTLGKMLDNQIYLDSLFTFILYSQTVVDQKTGKVSYTFQTHSDGTSTCKSPVGCFDESLIPNDMGLVVQKINEYYA